MDHLIKIKKGEGQVADENREWNPDDEVTITRQQLASIVAARLDLEKRVIHKSFGEDKLTAYLLGECITTMCASLCALIFEDITIDELINNIEEIDDDDGTE